ncbi:MAG: ABC transporter ATP-binding protein, partial [Pseudomonadota bacterium]|nr:ABC transporter ATP-binding protein [Pseudomonadota bacterium]
RPRVLLLDEPLAALDAKLKESLRDELAELLRRLGITAVHVTHDQHEAFAIADRLAVMHAGSIVQVGDAETLYRAPTHAFVAEFLGRVNRLERDADAVARGVVKLGGVEWACPARSSMASVLVRPEDLQLGPRRSDWAAATVRHRIFLGERIQLRVEAAGQPPLVADVPRDSPFQVGDDVGLWIAPDRLMASMAGAA